MSRPARILAGVTAAALAATVPGAVAQTAPDTGPRPLAPSNGKTLTKGKPFTFKVRSRQQGGVVIEVSKSRKRAKDGTLVAKDDLFYRTMVRKGSTFTKRTETYPALEDYFLNRPGRYYWQTHRIDCSAQSDCRVEGPIRSFRIR